MAEQKKESRLWHENRAFFQANTFKGARYLDDAGKILNEYRDLYHDGNVGLNGLHLSKPKTSDYPDEIAVDVNRIWIACYGDNSVKRLIETSESITKTISRLIGVSAYTRLGFRALYFKPAEDIKRYSREIYSKIASPEFQCLLKTDSVVEIVSNTKCKAPPFFIRLILQPIRITQPAINKSDFPEDGFAIDIDVTEDKDSSATTLNFDRLGKFIREASEQLINEALATTEFLKVSD